MSTPTREEQIAQINAHLGLAAEGHLTDSAIYRLRGLLGLVGKEWPDLDDPEEAAPAADSDAAAVNALATYPERWVKSPNYSGPETFRPRGAIFHFTGYSLGSALNWLTQKESRASYHVIIETDGSRVRLVDDTCRAWHAGGVNGSSKINGVNPNSACLGIAFTGNLYTGEHRGGLAALTDDEIESAMEFLALRWRKMNLRADWISDHRTVDPTRRNDIPPRELARLMARLGGPVA